MLEANKAVIRDCAAFNAGDFDALRAPHIEDAVVRAVLGWDVTCTRT